MTLMVESASYLLRPAAFLVVAAVAAFEALAAFLAGAAFGAALAAFLTAFLAAGLKRTGDVFESYFSNDNKTWKLYSTYTLKLPEELMVGLAVTSHNINEYTNAKFASVRLAK